MKTAGLIKINGVFLGRKPQFAKLPAGLSHQVLQQLLAVAPSAVGRQYRHAADMGDFVEG